MYIGGRFSDNFKTAPCIKIKKSIIIPDLSKGWNSNFDRGTFCYIISKNCANILINNFYDTINKREGCIKMMPIDHYMLKVFMKHDIKMYSSHPLLCHSPANSRIQILND